MPTVSVAVPMVVSGAAAALALEAGHGILPQEWSLPLTCLAGACMGGVMAVVMVPTPEPRTVRGEGVRWLGATLTATILGPAACQWLPQVNADNVLALSGLIGFLAWPITAAIQKHGPERFAKWLEKRGPEE